MARGLFAQRGGRAVVVAGGEVLARDGEIWISGVALPAQEGR